MKKFLILTLSLLTGALMLYATTFEELYNENLNKSSSLAQAELNLKNEKIKMEKIDNFFVPYLSLSVDTIKTEINPTTGKPITIGGLVFDKDGGIEGYSFALNTNFVEVWGASLALSFPFQIIFDDFDVQFPWDEDLQKQISLILSRDLTKLDRVDRLNTQASYYNALSNYYMAQMNVFIDTIQDIFSRYYNQEMIELSQRELEILHNQYQAATDEDLKESIEKQILIAQKTLEGLKSSNASLEYFEYSEELYNQTKDIVESIVNSNQSYSKNIEERLDLKALKLQEEASNIQKNFWFIPYIPFNNVSLSFSPFNDDNDWSISVGFQLAILDKGERKLASDTMKSNVATLTYDESVKKIEETVRGLETNTKTLNYDLNINQIDLDNALDEYNKNVDLYNKGYITKEDLDMSEINLQRTQLTKENTENNLLVNELRIMQQYYVQIWGDEN
ncbi:hypothetical protein PW5551_04375 [Petrotoga sp. 9PW.55.5.1]|uniref:TolC family protein n=1 Tax=Petrotoga sp. 9PW.55.5.1 TaxID=1308979 RepID=UPI000DC50B74|nr:TolC family protein [Petrotoga sp. 9PW.55.5.1]RAO99376.1 hypothetical protein PW5551_04375 [Petrotoga sp. 9PW.55.5.1]